MPKKPQLALVSVALPREFYCQNVLLKNQLKSSINYYQIFSIIS